MKLQETALVYPACTYEANINGKLNQGYSSFIHNLKCNLFNFVSGRLNILLDRIRIGDIVEFDNHMGTVRSVSLFSTTIETSRKRNIDIPNARIGESKTIRYKGREKHNPDLNFTLIDESCVDQAKDIVLKIMRSSNTLENKNNFTYTVYVSKDKKGNVKLTPFSYSKNSDTWSTIWSLKKEMTTELQKAGCIR